MPITENEEEVLTRADKAGYETRDWRAWLESGRNGPRPKIRKKEPEEIYQEQKSKAIQFPSGDTAKDIEDIQNRTQTALTGSREPLLRGLETAGATAQQFTSGVDDAVLLGAGKRILRHAANPFRPSETVLQSLSGGEQAPNPGMALPGSRTAGAITGSIIPGASRAIGKASSYMLGKIFPQIAGEGILAGSVRGGLTGGAAGGAIGAGQAVTAGEDIAEGTKQGIKSGTVFGAAAGALGGASNRIRNPEAFGKPSTQSSRNIQAIESEGGEIDLPGKGIKLPSIEYAEGRPLASGSLGTSQVSRDTANAIMEKSAMTKRAAEDTWNSAVETHLTDRASGEKVLARLINRLNETTAETGATIPGSEGVRREILNTINVVSKHIPAKAAIEPVLTDQYGRKIGGSPAEPARIEPHNAMVKDLIKTRQELDRAAEWGMPQTQENYPYRATSKVLREAIAEASPETNVANKQLSSVYDELTDVNELLTKSIDTTQIADTASMRDRISAALQSQSNAGSGGTAADRTYLNIQEAVKNHPWLAPYANRVHAQGAKEAMELSASDFPIISMLVRPGGQQQPPSARVGLPSAAKLGARFVYPAGKAASKKTGEIGATGTVMTRAAKKEKERESRAE